jgi:hypothetical protein
MMKTLGHGPAPGPAAWRHAGNPGKMGVIDIRAVRMEDVPEIAAVHLRSWRAAYRARCRRPTSTTLTPVSGSARGNGSCRRQRGLVAADAGGRLSGFVRYGPARDDDADSRQAGEIYPIYLMSAAWDEGIGRQLMAAASTVSAKRGLTR